MSNFCAYGANDGAGSDKPISELLCHTGTAVCCTLYCQQPQAGPNVAEQHCKKCQYYLLAGAEPGRYHKQTQGPVRRQAGPAFCPSQLLDVAMLSLSASPLEIISLVKTIMISKPCLTA